MISRDYKELLPSYLDGENIRNHAEILMKQDKLVDEKIELVSEWNNLRRPILIEKIQTEHHVATVKIHVHTPSPIRSVRGVGDFASIDEEYSEEELVTDAVFEVTVRVSIGEPPIIMFNGSVQVETYDDTVYTKGYPENDTPQGNTNDHDEALDVVGALLGIPRRTYKIPPNPMNWDYFPYTYPPYFVKDSNAPYWTEDDYYYSQRLQNFCNGVDRKDFIVHMAEVLYNWTDCSIIHCENRTTYIYTELQQLVGENTTYDLLTTKNRYTNIDYSNMPEILNNYYSVTRLIFPIVANWMFWRYPVVDYNNATHGLSISGTMRYSQPFGTIDLYLYDTVFDVTYYSVDKEESSSETVIKHSHSGRVDCSHILTYTDIFAQIKLRDAYEFTVYVGEYSSRWYSKEYWLNVLTDYRFSSLDDIIELIGETNNSQKPFNLSNWYCTYDEEEGAPNGLLNGSLYFGKLCNNFTPSLPDSDWLVCMEFYTNQYFEKYGDTVEIAYLNTVDGSIVLKVEAVNGSTQWGTDWNVTIEEYTGTTLTDSTSVGDINLFHGSLMLERSGNRISFAYIDTSGGRVLYQRDYTNLSICGCLYVRNSATWKTRLENHYRYRIGEYNSDKTDLPVYKQNEWAFISRGTGSTDPIITDEGTIQTGLYNYHTWKQAIDTTKTYNIYFYKETIYGDLYIGVCNSNTGIPSRYPGLVINQSNAGITSQSINKATLFYNDSTEKWCIMINDNPQYVKEQMEHGDARYISIRTETSNTAMQNRILAITEETNE